MLAIGGHELGHTTKENMAMAPGPQKEANASKTSIEISKTSPDVVPGTIKFTNEEVQK